MVEIPSVAVMIKEFLEEVDFISIGTNDLTQYTLAVDRNNEVIAEYYEPLNPAVLKLIYHCIHIANKEGKFVSVCGEIAGDYNYTRLLLAMGLRVFSMPQESVKFVKNVIVNTHTAELKKLLDSVKRALTPSEVKEIMEKDLEDFISRIGEPLKYAKRGK
jgi:phosphotransferase system enzyme I (PtsI)